MIPKKFFQSKRTAIKFPSAVRARRTNIQRAVKAVEAVRKVSAAPVNVGSTVKVVQPRLSVGSQDSITLTGTDYIGAVSVPANATIVPGSLLFSFPMALRHLTKTRLYRFSQLYEYWDVEALEFQFTSSRATTVEGSYAMMFDYDPEDYDPTMADKDMNDVFGHKVHIQNKFWQNSRLVVPKDPRRGLRELYTTTQGTEAVEDRDRLSVFGALTMVSCDAIPSSTSVVPMGQMFITYRIRLYGPSLHNGLAGGAYYEMSGAKSDATKKDIMISRDSWGDTNRKLLPLTTKGDGTLWTAARRLAQKAFGDGGESVVNNVQSLATNAQQFINAIAPVVNFVSTVIGTDENGNEISANNDFITLEPGCYRWITTLSSETAAGEFSGTTFTLTRTYPGCYIAPVMQGMIAPPASYISKWWPYVQAYAPSTAYARDLVFMAELCVLRRCQLGVTLITSDVGVTQEGFLSSAATQYCRVVHSIDKMANMTAGSWSSITPGAANALAGDGDETGMDTTWVSNGNQVTGIVDFSRSIPSGSRLNSTAGPADDPMDVDYPESDCGSVPSSICAATAQQLAASTTLQSLPADVRARVLKAATLK